MQSAELEQSELPPTAHAELSATGQRPSHDFVRGGASGSRLATERPLEARGEYSPQVLIARLRKISPARRASRWQKSGAEIRNRLAMRHSPFEKPTTFAATWPNPRSRKPSTEATPKRLPAGNTRTARYDDKDFSRTVPGCARQ